MGAFIRLLIRLPVFKPVLRFLIGMIAIPAFRFVLRHVVRLQDMDKELEKDLEQWFRGSLLLLVATQNMEDGLFGWIYTLVGSDSGVGIEGLEVGGEGASAGAKGGIDLSTLSGRIVGALRIMLAVGVTEAMPDQELFAVIYPGPPKLKFEKGKILRGIREQSWPLVRGLLCRHLDRSSQVFAIAAAIFDGQSGWVCYFMAITQYLIIGLVTSRSRAMDALERFDREVQMRRDKLKTQIGEGIAEGDAAPIPAPYETIDPPELPLPPLGRHDPPESRPT